MFVSMVGGRSPGMIARIPLLRTDDEVTDAVNTILPALTRNDVTTVALVAFEDAAGDSDPLLSRVEGAIVAGGIAVHSVIVVRDGMAHVGGGEPTPVALTPGQRAAFPPGPLAQREALSERYRGAVPHEVYTALQARAGRVTREDALAAWALVATVDPEAPAVADLPPVTLADAALTLAHKTSRDGLMAWMCPGVLPSDLLPAPLWEALKAVLPAQTWTVDVQDRQALRERLRAFCRMIPDAHAVPVLTVAASLEWWAGDGALARTALDLARELDPGYRLAALMDQMLTLGIRVGEPLR